MSREEALQEFLNSFEGSSGNRDGKVTLDEWMRHYEEVSCSIDHDDYFGTMMASTWAHLKQKMPDGSKVLSSRLGHLAEASFCMTPVFFLGSSQAPAVKYTPRADVDLLEKQLKKSICARRPLLHASRMRAT